MTHEHVDDVVRLVMSVMDGFDAPWGIAGGWALDLFLGRVTRAHGDVELAIFRDDQSGLRRHLRGWTFEKVVGGRLEAWRDAEILALPVHEIHGRSDEPVPCAVEFLLNEREGAQWVYRRKPAVTLPLERAMIRAYDDVAVLAPEIVLLFKAKSPRAKDEADFRSACGALDEPRRRWLRAALDVCHPGHSWMDVLE